MSIELAEAKFLAGQMNRELRSKNIKSYYLQDYERLQRIGMLNKNITTFDQIVNREIKSVVSRGNVIWIKLNNGINLILGLEYGGEILFYKNQKTDSKFHLKLDFVDNTSLTVRLTSMSIIKAMSESDLINCYVHKRDFNPEKLSPIDEEFTYKTFSKLLESKNRMLKSMLVGKQAVVVGLSNSSFQDIIYRAGLHPKRRASDLTENEKHALYDAITLILKERINLNCKDQFYDLYGNQGSYTPAMGPNMKHKRCSKCRTLIEKLSVSGGYIYLCPNCQI